VLLLSLYVSDVVISTQPARPHNRLARHPTDKRHATPPSAQNTPKATCQPGPPQPTPHHRQPSGWFMIRSYRFDGSAVLCVLTSGLCSVMHFLTGEQVLVAVFRVFFNGFLCVDAFVFSARRLDKVRHWHPLSGARSGALRDPVMVSVSRK